MTFDCLHSDSYLSSRKDIAAFLAIIERERKTYLPPCQALSIMDIEVDTFRLMRLFPRQPDDNNMEAPLSRSSLYGSSYLDYMNYAAEKLGSNPDLRTPKGHIEEWLRNNWPSDLPAPTSSKVGAMATFLRHPKHEKGGNLPKSLNNSHRTARSPRG
jgi:hypothetical protein